MKEKKDKAAKYKKELRIGDYNNFLVVQKTQKGFYIEEAGEKLFVPKKELSAKIQEGHRVKLFLYNKGEDRLTVTSATPLALVNQFAYLKVKEVTDFGVFMEWGIPKDLFVPKRFLKSPLEKGESVIVRLIPDGESRQVIGSTLWEEYIDQKPGKGLKVNQQANLLVCGIKDIGLRVIVNQRYLGMIYHDQGTEQIKYGQKLQGYISKIRKDGRLDIALSR